MIGPTNQKNWLTFGVNVVLDTDSGSLFHFPHHCGIGDFRMFIFCEHFSYSHRPIFMTFGKMTDTHKIMNPQHFGSDLSDIQISRFESWITFGWGLDALAEVCTLWAQSSYTCDCCWVVTRHIWHNHHSCIWRLAFLHLVTSSALLSRSVLNSHVPGVTWLSEWLQIIDIFRDDYVRGWVVVWSVKCNYSLVEWFVWAAKLVTDIPIQPDLWGFWSVWSVHSLFTVCTYIMRSAIILHSQCCVFTRAVKQLIFLIML